MIRKKYLYLVMMSMWAVVLFFCSSCTMLQYPVDQAKDSKQSKVSPSVGQNSSELPEYAILEQKGDSAIKAGQYRSALNIYNHLLSKYSGQDREKLLGKTEALLSIMKNSDLEVVLQSSKKQIPESMLLYRLGVNYAKKEDNEKAKEMLTKLLSDYPGYPRAEEVKKILKTLEVREFGKNTIGCMLPLSGKYQIFGKQALRGIQMAQDELKALYSGQEIQFVIKDTESSNDKAVECVRELAKTKIAAIAGPLVTSEAAAKEAQKYKIPMVCITQKSEVTSAGDYIFSNFITPEIQIKGLVSHAENRLGIKKFAILYPDDKYGQTFMALFRQGVSEVGGNLVVAEVYRANQTDFSSAIKKIASVLPQEPGSLSESSDSVAIFIPDAPSRLSLILPQLIYYNVQNVYLLGTNIWHNNALLKLAPEHVKNTVITDGYFFGSIKPESARFAQAFKSIYGEEPGLIEAIAYDTASMLLKTAMGEDVDSRESLKKVLAGNLIYSGVTGETMFEPNGIARKELFFLTIENNSFVEINR